MLLCAGILGRYYTDEHDVDEDLRTISNQGGRRDLGIFVGITQRGMADAPTNSHDVVASRRILYLLPHYKNTLIILYLELC